MKKIFIIFIVCVLLVSCNTSAKVSNDSFPSKYATLEFWNGSACIGAYKNVSMIVTMIHSETITNSISFYKYHIINKNQNIDEYIIDSEALAIKFTLPEEE